MISKERLAHLCQSIRRNSFSVCCGLALILLLIALLSTFDFGCNVIIDGKIIGTAKSKDCVYNLIDNINENFAPYFQEANPISVKPTITPKLVYKGHFTSEEKLSEALKATCPYLKKAYSIKSNGTTVVAFSSKEECKKTFNDFISQYADVNDKSSYKICDKVVFAYESVPYALIKSGDRALNMLNRTYAFDDNIRISKSITANDILIKYNISKEDFKKLNPEFESGKTTTVKIVSNIPYIRVLTNTKSTEMQVLKYKTRSVNDSDLYINETKVDKNGSDGMKTTVKNTCKINGNSVYETVSSTKTVKATDEVIVVGTKNYSKGMATNDFERPYDGKLSSRFGQRGARQHNGIDISGKVGDDIVAADGGKVTYASWEDGYGFVVKIDHQNGYTTYYAHCNELFVKVGDKVAKGDVIAALGNTGNSTGPHLHFEIRKTSNNTPLNPLEFIQ